MIIDFKKKRFLQSSTYLIDQIKWVCLVFLVLIVGSCLFLDKPTALFFSKAPLTIQELFRFFEKICCPFFWILATQAVFFYVRFIIRKEKKSRKFWYISLAVVLSIFLAKVIALCFGRATPDWFLIHGEAPFRFFEWNPSFHSFPSLTSVTISAFAASLACILPKSRLYLLVGGFVLSFIPVITTSSFLSDALLGYLVGTLVSQWVFGKMRRELSIT